MLISTIIIFIFASSVYAQDTSGFREVECISLDKEVVEFHYCRIEKPSNAVSFSFTFKKKITRPYYMQATVSAKSGKIYKDLFKTDPIEWCSAMEGKNLNPMMKMAIDQGRPMAPRMFAKCPYEGRFNVDNVSMNGISIPYGNGFYKVNMIATYKDKPIINMTIVSEIKKAMG